MPNRPTDKQWPRAFEPEIHRRKVTDPCAWSCHCRNSALREVIHALEWFARGNPERVVFADVDIITKKCNGKYREGGVQRYHYRSIEEVMQLLRAHRVLSPYGNFLINTSSGRVWRRGWVFAPHDFLFRRDRRRCTFVGFGNALVERGLPALPPRMPHVWIPEYGVEKAENSVA
jgi:hypothetical protein